MEYDNWTDSEIAEEVSRALNADYREIGKATLKELLTQVKMRVLEKDPLPADVIEPTAV